MGVSIRRLFVWGTALLASVAVVAGGTAQADPEPHPQLKDFLLSGQYVLQVKGEDVPSAKIYYSSPCGGYLILADGIFKGGVLVLPRTYCVESVKPDEMHVRDDGAVDVLLVAEPCGLGKFHLEGADVVFNLKQGPARLKPKPPLLGTHWAAQLIEHTPEYARAAAAYEPDPERMDILAKSKMEARIQIFFGTWCSFCSKFIPNTLKVEEELKKRGSKLSFEYHGLPPPPAAWVTKEAVRMGVKKLPTGFIFVDDKLIGRLEGNDWIRPEVSLSRIIH